MLLDFGDLHDVFVENLALTEGMEEAYKAKHMHEMTFEYLLGRYFW